MLTSSENRCLIAIRDHILENRQSPTLAELGKRMGISSRGTVHRYVSTLIEAGYLEKSQKGHSRGLKLTNQAKEDLFSLPLYGRIAAGQPIEAIAGQSRINLADTLIKPDRYVLQVKGDSMIEAGICDGDMAIIECRDHARDNEIVVALINNESATLKRYLHSENNTILLIPANCEMAAQEYLEDQVKIQGVLVSILRTYQS